ncbi:MAG: hypothetical protein EGR83_14390 [Bacteroides cellulosilyticus]|nr:hypothetical protein [Bacteroides cellulosilyticus]
MKLLRQQTSSFAAVLPIFCRRIGKLLPSQWQDFAKPMARLCHSFGKMLAKYRLRLYHSEGIALP